jgi:hypothetical protein
MLEISRRYHFLALCNYMNVLIKLWYMYGINWWVKLLEKYQKLMEIPL